MAEKQMSDRERRRAALAARTEENYSRREGERLFHGFFDPNADFPLWIADAGEHVVDIIPYDAGPNDPRVKEGDPQYVLDLYVHRNVGPRDLQFLCLERNYNQACPICEYKNHLQKNPPASGKDSEEHKEAVKALRPSRRAVYNVVVLDTDDTEAEGVRVWEIAHFFMEAKLLANAKLTKQEGGGYIVFADADEGRSIRFERQGSGSSNTKYEGHRFIPREPLPDEWLEGAWKLDELPYVPDYDEVREAFYASGPEGEEEGSEPEGDKAPASRSRASRAQGGGDEDASAATRPSRSRSSRAAAAESEPAGDAEPTPSRRAASRSKDPGEEVPQAQSAPFTVDDDEPTPRRRASKPNSEGEKSGKGGGRLQPLEDEPEEGEPTPECPVPDGTFGQDAGAFDECESCDFFRDCLRESAQHRKATRQKG